MDDFKPLDLRDLRGDFTTQEKRLLQERDEAYLHAWRPASSRSLSAGWVREGQQVAALRSAGTRDLHLAASAFED